MASDGIAIIGGGIGGLAAALGMLRRGIDVDVYEQATEMEELGAGVQVGPNGTAALHALGLDEALAQVQVIAAGKEIRLWNTGQTWKLFDLGAISIERYGHPYVMLHRGDLQTALAMAVAREKSDAIHLGKRCRAVEQSGDTVAITFDDGSAIEASAAIGADGIHSKVRECLFGTDRPEFAGIVAWRGLIPAERVPPGIKMNVATNWVGPGAHVVHYPLRRGELLNFVGLKERDDWQVESWTVRGTRAELAEDFRGWHSDVQAMIEAIDEPYKWALAGRAPLERWTQGGVTLLGDACHSMLPMLAQGACMAIEDGVVLARCVEKYPDLDVALQAYETARRERANAAVRGSAENGKRFHDRSMANAEAADAYVTREWQEDKVKMRYEWLFTYDAASVTL